MSTSLTQALRYLNARLGLHSGLAARSVKPAMFDRVVAGSLTDHCHKTNSAPASRENDREILAVYM